MAGMARYANKKSFPSFFSMTLALYAVSIVLLVCISLSLKNSYILSSCCTELISDLVLKSENIGSTALIQASLVVISLPCESNKATLSKFWYWVSRIVAEAPSLRGALMLAISVSVSSPSLTRKSFLIV